jgi:hypothetical protein
MPLILHDANPVDQIPATFFGTIPIAANGYAVLEVNGPELVITYYLSYTVAHSSPKDHPAVRET